MLLPSGDLPPAPVLEGHSPEVGSWALHAGIPDGAGPHMCPHRVRSATQHNALNGVPLLCCCWPV